MINTRSFLNFAALALIILWGHAASAVATGASPHLAIVISEASYDEDWQSTQMSAHGWTALAHLAGIPYDTLTVAELIDTDLDAYSCLIFTQASRVYHPLYHPLAGKLQHYLAGTGGIIIDDLLGFYDETGKPNGNELNTILGVQYGGKHGGPDYRLSVQRNSHYVTRKLQPGQTLSQGLAGGLDILEPAGGDAPLIIAGNGVDAFSFLSAIRVNGARVVLISELGTESGPATLFRKKEPAGFYPNEVLEPVLRSIYWAIYGDIDRPFPVMQLTNADLAAILRLDADLSGDSGVQRRTLRYLIDLARDTGAVPVYGWVSQRATETGWENIAAIGKEVEDVGGEIGTHSKTHFFNRHVDAELAKTELDGSVAEIESNMQRLGFPIGDVDFFINPGKTIFMKDYDEIARRFSLYMTHGFQFSMPVGYGLTDWFTNPGRELAVIENSATSDYQWFYAPGSTYTREQAIAYETAIFDHMLHKLGRSVIFNLMWHDYSIGHKDSISDRLRSLWSPDYIPAHLLYYDALHERFSANDLYFPTPVDLVQKLRAAARCRYDWESTETRIDLTLDCRDAGNNAVPDYIGGMGVRIENSDRVIQAVHINDKPYFGFRDRVVVLPNLTGDRMKISITLGESPSMEPRLIYASKRTPVISKTADDLVISLLTKSMAKFAFYAPGPYLLLNADAQWRDTRVDRILRGYVKSNRDVILRRISPPAFSLLRSEVPITGITRTPDGLAIELQRSGGVFKFSASQAPTGIVLNDLRLQINKEGSVYKLRLPSLSCNSRLVINLPGVSPDGP
jgi:hypothetical protein